MPSEILAGLRKRPLSVWVLCILNGVLAVALIGTGIKAASFGFSSGQAVIAAIAGIVISIGAHATWFGNRLGRLVLLAALTLFLGAIVVQSAMVVAWSFETAYRGPLVTAAWMYIGLSLAWLCVNYLFLYGRRAKTFFG